MWGVEGGLVNHQTFYEIFSLKPSLNRAQFVYIGSVCVYTLCSVWGVVAGAPNQALSWQRAALTLPCWLVENIKNMVAGGDNWWQISNPLLCVIADNVYEWTAFHNLPKGRETEQC